MRNSKPRILVASDEEAFMPPLCEAYAQLGFDVVAGVSNFYMQKGEFDAVQYLWPEEYCGWWQTPDEKKFAILKKSLEYWLQHSWPITIVNNFYPHGREHDPAFQRLYDMFYGHSRNIVHYSRTSHDAVLKEFPSSRNSKHSISNYCAYHELRHGSTTRQNARTSLGIADDEFVILVFGAMRSWREIELLMRAYSAARIERKRLLLVSRYIEQQPVGRLERRWRQFRYKSWLSAKGAITILDRIPNEDIERYFLAADAVPVLRIKEMCSGVVGMGVTFGKLLLAPDMPAYREYLAGTKNLFYKAGDPLSLAQAIETAVALDRTRIGDHNMKMSADWNWATIARVSLRGFPGADTLLGGPAVTVCEQ